MDGHIWVVYGLYLDYVRVVKHLTGMHIQVVLVALSFAEAC